MNPVAGKQGAVVESFDTAGAWADVPVSPERATVRGFRDAGSPRGTVAGSTHVSRIAARKTWVRMVEDAIRRSADYFARTQHPDGYWWAELESNVSITAEYLMLLRLLEQANPERDRRIVKYLFNLQNSDGSWSLYKGDGGELSTTIETYFALKLTGEDIDSPAMSSARSYILNHGGIECSRTFTKIWLALFSQYEWDEIPSMPVELVLLPQTLYFSIYEFSSWARGTAVPLSIVLAIRPHVTLPEHLSIRELYVAKVPCVRKFKSRTHKFFFVLDRIAKAFERKPVPSIRNKAVQAAERWILDHQEATGDWGGIQPPMAYSMLALHYLGYTMDHPAMRKGLRAIEEFCLEDELGLRMQSCLSPVWDTALTALALVNAGIAPEHPVLRKSGEWLLQNQVRTGGDWQVKCAAQPGGWAFEFCNTIYPDVDDSAVVLMALDLLHTPDWTEMGEAKSRGMKWCLEMQSTSGGWAAFDRNNEMTILNRIPFADQEAMVDPPTADITGRMLEVMGQMGYDKSHPGALKGIQFLINEQEPDGCWWGRWGVNYIYGTWSVLRGLMLIGMDPGTPMIQAAVHWLKSKQNQDGGWGETCESYSRPELRGQGPSTPSQTAWALMGLLCCGEESNPQVKAGVKYLVANQRQDGSWDEEYFTGTGFPGHFYIRYHNYRNCFPLMALGQYVARVKS